jgi:hypothetical protein
MPKKVAQYENERKNILKKIFEILGLDENNNMFGLHKIDNSEIIQNNILELEPEIKKYFTCSEWSCFKRKDKINRRWLSFIKYIFKDMNINLGKSIIIGKAGNYENSGTVYCVNLEF